MPFTLSVLEPFTFEVGCQTEHALSVASLGWFIGRSRWGLC